MSGAWVLYILQAIVHGERYIGVTTDIENQLQEHEDHPEALSFQGEPWRLVYTESFTSHDAARARKEFLSTKESGSFLLRIEDGTDDS